MTWRRTRAPQTETEPTGCAPGDLQLLAAPVVDGPHELEWSAMTDTVMRVVEDRPPAAASPPPLRLLSQPDVFALPSGPHLRSDICVVVCQQIAWAAGQATQNEWVVLAWGAPLGDDGHSWEMNATAFSAAPQPGLCSTAVLCRQFMRVRRGERASFGVPPARRSWPCPGQWACWSRSWSVSPSGTA